jgi:DnaK suppressor protein
MPVEKAGIFFFTIFTIMEERNTDEIKARIEQEIEKTEKLITEYRELTKPISPDNAIGRVSRMDAINNRSVNEASLRQAEKKLEDLKRVLKQAGSDDFGRCLKCRKPIPLGRILFRPESLYCVNCAR